MLCVVYYYYYLFIYYYSLLLSIILYETNQNENLSNECSFLSFLSKRTLTWFTTPYGFVL